MPLGFGFGRGLRVIKLRVSVSFLGLWEWVRGGGKVPASGRAKGKTLPLRVRMIRGMDALGSAFPGAAARVAWTLSSFGQGNSWLWMHW